MHSNQIKQSGYFLKFLISKADLFYLQLSNLKDLILFKIENNSIFEELFPKILLNLENFG